MAGVGWVALAKIPSWNLLSMPGVETYALYKQLTTLPVIGESVGKRIFSFAFGQVAPYFASVRPQFVTIRPNYAELTIKKRRAVKNHIGTVHAIAVCNGLEAAMGALAEASIPKDRLEQFRLLAEVLRVWWTIPLGLGSEIGSKAAGLLDILRVQGAQFGAPRRWPRWSATVIRTPGTCWNMRLPGVGVGRDGALSIPMVSGASGPTTWAW